MTVSEVSPLIKLTNQVYLKLRNASEHRAESTAELFSYQFTNIPECLYDAKKQTPYHSSKSQLLTLLSPGCVADPSKGKMV